MNNEPTLKKKEYNFKAQYVYNAILLVILTLGITYAFVFFLHNEPGTTANLKSSLVTVDVSEDGTISLTNLQPVTDDVGITGVSKVITVTNTSSIDALLKISLNPSENNTISTESIKYGLYINGELEETDYVRTDNIIYDGLLLAGETVKYEIYLWVDANYTGNGTSFGGTFDVETSEAVMTIADYVTKFVGKDKGIYAINSSGAVSADGSDVREYRYSGTDVDNYVWFNCKDGYTSGSSNCELWRIVGSFDVKAGESTNSYQRVKLVKEETLDNRTFGSNNTYSGSSLDTYLNGDYYNSLTNSAKKMIIEGEWNVGSSVLTNTPNASLTSEITSKVYKKIGLLSASDIGYATTTTNYTKALNNTDLYTNSWLKGSSYYTLTPITSSTTNVIGDNATAITSLAVDSATGIKPAVYLMPNVYVQGGNGTLDKPYEVSYVDEVEHYSNVKVVGHITYNVNGASVDAPKKQAIFADGSTTINQELTESTLGSFAGWATSSDGEVVYQKGDKLTETSDVTLYAVWLSKDLATRIENSITLSAADVDGTRFVTGDTVNNNYVWYSGKLWRIVSVDEDGNVKLVTQGNMTTIAWSFTSSNTDYSTAQIRNWLNNEFLPTLYNADDLLVDYEWDYTTYTDFPTQKATENIMKLTGENAEKVGLLNIYEYMMTGGTTSSSTSKTFLNNGYYWWTMSYKGEGSQIWLISNNGDALSNGNINIYGVRPSINLVSGVQILSGLGTSSNPYVINGDKEAGIEMELLNNRLSGEYINFNDVTYRIVGVEKFNGVDLTKVTMADYDINKNSLTNAIIFSDSDTDKVYNTNNGVGKYMYDWYNATSENDLDETYKGLYISKNYWDMIATTDEDGIFWYISDGVTNWKDYVNSKSGATIETPIGLGYYGEIFSSQFSEKANTSTNIWLMTKYSNSSNWYVSSTGEGNGKSQSNLYGARPSFYLKADVKITGGTGQPGTPYEISQ